jgi:hypothetical protein
MAKVAKVEAIKTFTDSVGGVMRRKGDVFECSADRAEALVNFKNEGRAFQLVKVLEISEIVEAEVVEIEKDDFSHYGAEDYSLQNAKSALIEKKKPVAKKKTVSKKKK